MSVPKHTFKLLDCTIRDGGLVTDSRFEDSLVTAAYNACADANIDFFEIGFKNSEEFFAPDKFGKWRFCKEDQVRAAIGESPRSIKISELADIGKCNWKDFAKKRDSVVDMIRCAFYEPQADSAIELVNACADKGYQTALCMMAVSTLDDCTIEKALEKFAASNACVIYLMDSFGGLIPAEVARLAPKYKDAAHSSGKLFGAHFHNNMQCAFANSIEAAKCGADILDCSLSGLGKGAGNCPTEMLLQYANAQNPRYSLRPILSVDENYIEPLRGKYRWGFDYPYMMTGLLNLHPRDAMEFEKNISQNKSASIVDFYDNHFNK